MFTITDLEATRTVEEVAAFVTQLKARSTELDTEWAGRSFDDEAREEFAGLRDILKAAEDRKAEFSARRDWVQSLAKDEGRSERAGTDLSTRARAVSRIPEDPFDLSAYRGISSTHEGEIALMRDGARKVAEQAHYPHDRSTIERTVAQIDRMLTEDDDKDGTLARHIIATGSPTYGRAWGKKLLGRGVSADEQRAIDVVGSGALTTGGYAVPFTLDPTVILTSNGSTNPLRDISRIERVIGNTWKGVTSAGITITRGPAEDQPVTPTSPTFGQPEVTAQPVKVEIQFSIEADEDWPRLQAEMARIFQDAKDAEEAESFVNGVGTTVYPEGVVAGLASTSFVGTDSDGLSLDDIDRIIGRLPDRYEPNAKFLAHRVVYGQIERLDRAAGAGSLYRPLAAGAPGSLLGYPRYNSSAMDSDFTSTGDKILLFGDFSNFLIVEKIGMTVELDPHVRNGDGKWIGKRALLMHYRNTSVILNDNAFRLLVVGSVTS